MEGRAHVGFSRDHGLGMLGFLGFRVLGLIDRVLDYRRKGFNDFRGCLTNCSSRAWPGQLMYITKTETMPYALGEAGARDCGHKTTQCRNRIR